MTEGAQAINLHIPRVCIYCGMHIAAEGQVCCGFCAQNSYQSVLDSVLVRDPPQAASWWSRLLMRWHRDP